MCKCMNNLRLVNKLMTKKKCRLALDYTFCEMQKRKMLVINCIALIGPKPCGGGEIRTPGTFQYDGFQDRSIKPLWHSSGSKRAQTYGFSGNLPTYIFFPALLKKCAVSRSVPGA